MTTRRAETIAIGSELLGAERVDTNGLFLSRCLEEKGIAVAFRTVVGDDPVDLRAALGTALGRADLVIATGGLGPTVDDLTREAVSDLLGLPLAEDAGVLRDIEERFRRYKFQMADNNRRQAMVPRGAEVLPNPLGTAPGLLLRPEGRLLALLPGVPIEMERMVRESLLPRIEAGDGILAHRVLRIAGLGESDVDRRLAAVHAGSAPVEWTILASPGQVEIHLRERVRGAGEATTIERLDREIADVLGVHLFGRDADTLEGVVSRLLLERGARVATAESVTGGGVARRITSVPGASLRFAGGAVCYTDAAKAALAGVEPATLAAEGAVSAAVGLQMAEGIRRRLGAEWGLATTGYAGPDAGGPDRPVGTVFLALAGPGVSVTREALFPGQRATIQDRAAQAALDLLRRGLLGSIT